MSTPGAQLIRLTDIDQLAGLFDQWQGRIDQVSGGRFDATLRVVRGRVMRAVDILANQRVRIRGHDAAGVFMLHPVSAGSAASLWQGRVLTVGQLVLTGPENETDYTSPRQTAQMSVAFRPADLEDAVRALLNSDVSGLPHHWAALTPPLAALNRLNDSLREFVQLGNSTPALLRTATGRQLEQECLRAVVATLTAPETARPSLPMPTRHRLVVQAEEMMRGHLTDPLAAVDLCRELRVSDRTLRLAFRERFGLGPMGYYKRLRLNAVRATLKADAGLTIALAALAFNFHHLSNFAADYRRLFGENPSDTPR